MAVWDFLNRVLGLLGKSTLSLQGSVKPRLKVSRGWVVSDKGLIHSALGG